MALGGDAEVDHLHAVRLRCHRLEVILDTVTCRQATVAPMRKPKCASGVGTWAPSWRAAESGNAIVVRRMK